VRQPASRRNEPLRAGKVVQVSRHGVRSPTDTDKLVKATGRAWTPWLVQDGELTGHDVRKHLEGFWIENGSDRRCSTPKNGRYYWGRVTLVFTGNGFSGRWSHCDDTPSHVWTGTRRGVHHSAPSPYDNADSFAVSTDHPDIEGLWSSSEGEISFRQQGNRITGRYTNDNGEIVGVLHNDTLSGYWIEDNSAQRCSTPKNGRYYWGRIEFVFPVTDSAVNMPTAMAS